MHKQVLSWSDDDLVILLKQGNNNAFQLIYDKHATKLYQAAYNIIRNKEICEDVIQELFIEIWLKRASLKINTSLKNYLFVSVKNRVLMKIRSRKIMLSTDVLEFLTDNYTADSMTMEKEFKQILVQEVSQLPKKCANIFRLSRNEHLSNKEIAKTLNLSVKTVENQISIAIKRLRSSMSDVLTIAMVLFIFFK